MADTYKILGQIRPAANVLTDIYATPAATSAIIAALVVCNAGLATSYNVKLAPGGAADANTQFTASGKAIAVNITINDLLAATLAATDVVRVSSVTGNVVFTLLGVEKT